MVENSLSTTVVGQGQGGMRMVIGGVQVMVYDRGASEDWLRKDRSKGVESGRKAREDIMSGTNGDSITCNQQHLDFGHA